MVCGDSVKQITKYPVDHANFMYKAMTPRKPVTAVTIAIRGMWRNSLNRSWLL